MTTISVTKKGLLKAKKVKKIIVKELKESKPEIDEELKKLKELIPLIKPMINFMRHLEWIIDSMYRLEMTCRYGKVGGVKNLYPPIKKDIEKWKRIALPDEIKINTHRHLLKEIDKTLKLIEKVYSKEYDPSNGTIPGYAFNF